MKESSIDSQKIIRRRQDGELEYLPDDLTIEEPLEISIGRKTLATTMRTPGHDEELAVGFLVSEAIVREREEIANISSDRDNRVTIDLKGGVKLKLNSTKRFGTISSSCGLCGKTSIDAIRQNFPAITSKESRVDIETLLSVPEKLRNAQSDFSRTGGIHAAGIFDALRPKLKIVSGYQGNSTMVVAMERGEVDGVTNSWDSWKSLNPAWIKEKMINLLVQTEPKSQRWSLAGVVAAGKATVGPLPVVTNR